MILARDAIVIEKAEAQAIVAAFRPRYWKDHDRLRKRAPAAYQAILRLEDVLRELEPEEA